MNITFDHIVLLVRDLDQATKDFEALGFTVLERADTSHGSTVFRFISFADGSYILLTAFTSEEGMKGHRLGSVLEAGEGWADYSFVVPSAGAAAQALGQAGFPVKGPVKVENVLAGGEAWGLDLLMTGRGAGGDNALPFLVTDNQGRGHRIPGPSDHANGANGIRSVTVSTGDVAKVVRTLEAIGGRIEAGAPNGQRVRFADVWVNVRSFAEAPEGRDGGGIVEVVVATSSGEARKLDMKLAHGAPILMAQV